MRKALLTLLERRQLDQITVRDIAVEAKIGYATFFRHHESKWELLKDVAEEEIGRLMALGLPLLAADDTRGSALALCKYVNDHRAIWSALLTGGAAGPCARSSSGRRCNMDLRRCSEAIGCPSNWAQFMASVPPSRFSPGG
jgi:AcrR family transcriptional regulator